MSPTSLRPPPVVCLIVVAGAGVGGLGGLWRERDLKPREDYNSHALSGPRDPSVYITVGCDRMIDKFGSVINVCVHGTSLVSSAGNAMGMNIPPPWWVVCCCRDQSVNIFGWRWRLKRSGEKFLGQLGCY